MMVRIPFDELCRLLSDYVQVGYMEAVRAYEPAADMVRQGEVRAWLKMVHVDADLFRKLVKRGKIRPVRRGEARNSPLYYSKKEIKQAVAAVAAMKAMGRGEELDNDDKQKTQA